MCGAASYYTPAFSGLQRKATDGAHRSVTGDSCADGSGEFLFAMQSVRGNYIDSQGITAILQCNKTVRSDSKKEVS
jgi:hypothetical protein